MKRFIIAFILVAICLPFAMGQLTTPNVQPVMLSSPESRWTELGTLTASNSYPAVTDRDYTTVSALPDANTITWDLPNYARKVQLSFQTTANADADVVVIMGFASNKTYDTSNSLSLDDDALYCGQLTLTGGQQTGKHTNVYVDTIVPSDGVFTFSALDSGNDRRCIVEFNAKGLGQLVMIATTLESATTLYAEGRIWQ